MTKGLSLTFFSRYDTDVHQYLKPRLVSVMTKFLLIFCGVKDFPKSGCRSLTGNCIQAMVRFESESLSHQEIPFHEGACNANSIFLYT